jgi:hypothetical protein
VRAWHEAGQIVIELAGGQTVRFPVAANERLRDAAPGQLDHIELSPFGLHWPDLDEDLSLRGILEGRYGRPRPPQTKPRRRPSASVRLRLMIAPATRRRIEALARQSGKSLSAVVEERFA